MNVYFAIFINNILYMSVAWLLRSSPGTWLLRSLRGFLAALAAVHGACIDTYF